MFNCRKLFLASVSNREVDVISCLKREDTQRPHGCDGGGKKGSGMVMISLAAQVRGPEKYNRQTFH
jgi:hypothetical protein